MLKELDAAHEEGLIERHSLLSLRERVQRVSDAAISEKRVREACLALTPKPWPKCCGSWVAPVGSLA
jgi:hypothetical protein